MGFEGLLGEKGQGDSHPPWKAHRLFHASLPEASSLFNHFPCYSHSRRKQSLPHMLLLTEVTLTLQLFDSILVHPGVIVKSYKIEQSQLSSTSVLVSSCLSFIFESECIDSEKAMVSFMESAIRK